MGSRLLPLSLALGAFTADAAGFHHIAYYLVLLAVVGAAAAALVRGGGGVRGEGGARRRRVDDTGARSAPAGVRRAKRRAGRRPGARFCGVDARPGRARLRPAAPRLARRAGRAEDATASPHGPVARLRA